MHDDDDEECRIFSGLGDVFDSYRVTTGVPHRNQNDDPYDYMYHNLPTKHHVLKKMKDCDFCGAMKLQFEGHAFCCKKEKVKIVTPAVPQELRRLYTSHVDDDAKYFRKHIRYFNTHFSFTSLGVTLCRDMCDVFSLPDGSTTDIVGVIMFVTPLEHETYFPVSMREVAVVDSNNYTVFIRFLGELAERHREQLLYGERHATFVIATSTKVDQASRSLLSVREQIEKDSSIREAVKNIVLLWRDAQKPANEELLMQVRSVKYMFNYIF